MQKIKCKIIENQIWTAENLTPSQYFFLSGIKIPKKNSQWDSFHTSKCFSYVTKFNSKQYLFDYESVRSFTFSSSSKCKFRIPTSHDLNILFNNIDSNAFIDKPGEKVAQSIRGVYGWISNGTNKIGFNAMPNPTINHKGVLQEFEIFRCWFFNLKSNQFEGLNLYSEDIISTSILDLNDGCVVRLVMDLEDIRLEENILYV
jgi:uncharacterized protein (TIGR02145 family)